MTTERRGAVRSEAARLAVLDAATELFGERGYDHLTIEGVAARAGVAKQTIYRWWRSKSELVAECLLEGRILPAELVPQDTGDLRADLTAWLDRLLTFVDTPRNGTLVRSLVLVAAENQTVARLLHEALGAPSYLTVRLATAVEAGELPDGTPVEEIAAAAVGAVVLQVLTRAPASEGKADRLVRALLG